MANNYYNLPTISGGVTGTDALDALNNTIAQTEAALNDLAGTVMTTNAKSAIIRQQVPISSDTALGDLVYYSVDDAVFKPAIAALLSIPGRQGESIEAPESRVEGMIVSKDVANNTGTLLQGGFYNSPACAAGCLGSSATAGTYYLSPLTAGKATKDPGGHLRQPVLSYYGDGQFSLSLFYLAHDNHFHATETINSWVNAGSEAPAGYPFKHTPSSDLGAISNEVTAVFCDGLLQITGSGKDFNIVDGILYSKANQTGVVVFNHFPFAYGSPVVRSVVSTDDSLGVTNRNGHVTLNPSPWVVGAARRSRMALSAIGGRVVDYTPVVTGITAGNGITATENTDGSVSLSASNRVGEPLDAYNLNFNGTTLASDDNLNSYITFPAGRTSASLAISLPITGITSGSNITARVWGIVKGTGQSFNVLEQFSAQPSVDTPSVDATPVSSSYTLALAGTSGAYTYAETAGGLAVSGNGNLTAKITLNTAPSSDVRLVRAGFRLVETASTVENTPVSLIDNAGTCIGSGAALAALPAFTCVYAVSGGGLQACSSTDIDTLNRCVGITLESVNSGETVNYVTDGVLQSPSLLGVSGGAAVYVGPSGGLTSIADYDNWAYVQQVGAAVTDKMMVVNIKNGTAATDN